MSRIQNAVKTLQGQPTGKKDYIPALPSSSNFIGGAGINRYGSKATQLRANIGAVWQANEIITIAAAGIPIKLRRRKADGKYEEITDHTVS